MYEGDLGHVGRPPPHHVWGEGVAPGVPSGGVDAPSRQQPRPQPEGAVVHDGVIGEAQHGQVHTEAGGAGRRGP